MSNIVMLDLEEFKEIYVEFSNKSDSLIKLIFNEAEMLCNNTSSSSIPYDPSNNINTRKLLLYLLTAHILTLKDRGAVGTLTSASEGSVSTSFSVEQRKGSGYFTQTEYGYKYWQLMIPYRFGGLFVHGIKRC